MMYYLIHFESDSFDFFIFSEMMNESSSTGQICPIVLSVPSESLRKNYSWNGYKKESVIHRRKKSVDE